MCIRVYRPSFIVPRTISPTSSAAKKKKGLSADDD